MRNIVLIEGQLLYSSRTTLYIASHQTLSNRCKGVATFVQSPSLFSSMNPDPWNAAYLSPCLFLSSSSRSTAPCLPRLASQFSWARSIPPCLSQLFPPSSLNTYYKSKHKITRALPSLISHTP